MKKAMLDYHKLVRDLSLNLEIPQDHITEFINTLVQAGALSLEESRLIITDREKVAALSEGTIGKF